MKQNPKIVIQIVVAAALLLTTGCSKDMEQGEGAAYSDVQILAASELSQDNVVVVPGSKTRAVADPTREMTFYLVRADETGKDTGVFGAYATTSLTATRAAGVGSRALSFATPQYYLVSNAKTRLTGWYPAATSLAGSTVRWTIDGTMDILTAPEQGGNMNVPMPNLVFNHALSQVQIHAYSPDANAQATWGTITKIELMEQTNTCTYDFATNCATGAVMPEIGTTGTFAVSNIAAATIPVAVAAQVGDPVMIAPQATAAVLNLEVTTSKLGKVEVSMPEGVYMQGKAYILKLKFSASTITATASIGAWQTIDRTEQEIVPSVPPLEIGDFKDGGIIYWVDPNDAKRCKVLSLDQESSLAWANQSSYVLGLTGQDNYDGQANVAAMKAYSADNTSNVDQTKRTTGVFATDFPAANFCESKNIGGVTGWYLPAREELVVVSVVYTIAANKTAIDAGLANSGGVTFPSSGEFWMSTEFATYNTRAWKLNFGSASVNNYSTKNERYGVRCIRYI